MEKARKRLQEKIDLDVEKAKERKQQVCLLCKAFCSKGFSMKY